MCFLPQLPEVTVLLHTHQVTGIVVRLEFKTTTGSCGKTQFYDELKKNNLQNLKKEESSLLLCFQI
jgi:hypothetical protein